MRVRATSLDWSSACLRMSLSRSILFFCRCYGKASSELTAVLLFYVSSICEIRLCLGRSQQKIGFVTVKIRQYKFTNFMERLGMQRSTMRKPRNRAHNTASPTTLRSCTARGIVAINKQISWLRTFIVSIKIFRFVNVRNYI